MNYKLIIIIPCLNEEQTLPSVIQSIPRSIPGIASIEILIVDDGSTDKTLEVAKTLGVHYIVRHMGNKGLARSFADGLEAALTHGADIIVNTDGDNQYPQSHIPELIQPILDGKADIVVADRQTEKIAEFSPLKKLMQRLGSSAVATLAGVNIPDAVSGFRAYSRAAAMDLTIVTDFSYCTETIIQAGKKRMNIVSIPITTNKKTRESRLFRNMFQHIRMSGSTMVRVFAMYEPLKTFSYLGGGLLSIGLLFFVRFAYFAVTGTGAGHIQSIVFGAVMFLAGFQVLVLGLVSDLIAANRKIVEQVLYNQKRKLYAKRATKRPVYGRRIKPFISIPRPASLAN